MMSDTRICANLDLNIVRLLVLEENVNPKYPLVTRNDAKFNDVM